MSRDGLHRVVIHWTAGDHTPNNTDRNAYHEIVDGNGDIHAGRHSFSANAAGRGRLRLGQYAAHVGRMNTGSIGIAIAGMRRAQERPFSPGPSPITQKQVTAMARRVAEICVEYDIPLTRETVLTHAEVEPTLGVRQNGKWDITWLPGMARVGDAVEVGDRIREEIRRHLASNVRREPRRCLAGSRTVKGGTVATAGTVGTAALEPIAEVLTDVNDMATGFGITLTTVQYMLIAITLLGLAWMIYARIDDWRREKR